MKPSGNAIIVENSLLGGIVMGAAMFSTPCNMIVHDCWVNSDERKTGFRQQTPLANPVVQVVEANAPEQNSANDRLTITPEAGVIIGKCPSIHEPILNGLNALGSYLGDDFRVKIDRFTDPYDGGKILTIELTSPSGYREVSRQIDRFCKEFWFEYMDSLPVSIIFEAGE